MKVSGFALAICAVAAAYGQTAPAKEPDTVQALLTEVRLLRQDIEGMTLASERVQIALFRLQTQETVAAHSAERLDSVRNRCSQVEKERRGFSDEIQRLEMAATAGSVDPGQTKASQANRLDDIKHGMERLNADLQSCQATESEATTRLRTDEAKLADAQGRIDRLDKELEKLGAGAK